MTHYVIYRIDTKIYTPNNDPYASDFTIGTLWSLDKDSAKAIVQEFVEKWKDNEPKCKIVQPDIPEWEELVFLKEHFLDNKLQYGDTVELSEGNICCFDKPDDYIINGLLIATPSRITWESREIENAMKEKGLRINRDNPRFIENFLENRRENLATYIAHGLIVVNELVYRWKDDEVAERFARVEYHYNKLGKFVSCYVLRKVTSK